jgi:serine-type D-Ala-D-Ala carboxypeptidase (penicillin-binding protein 5/6)
VWIAAQVGKVTISNVTAPIGYIAWSGLDAGSGEGPNRLVARQRRTRRTLTSCGRRPAAILTGLVLALALGGAALPDAGSARAASVRPDAAASPMASASPTASASPAAPASPGAPAAPGTGPAGPTAKALTAAQRREVGGTELASPGIVVDYPASGGRKLPKIPASAYVVANADTGQVLAAKDAHGLFQPASTLKVLTAITLLPLLSPDALVLASRRAASTQENDVGLIAGHRYQVADLFYALLLISANDAAVALTQATGSFSRGMSLINAEAHHLQAYDVVAKEPNGLPAPGQVVSAYDEALIARQALSMPSFMKYDSRLAFRFPVKKHKLVTLVNQNTLLTSYRGGIGGKIGWTSAAGATYIGLARRDGVTLIVTILHCTPLDEITSGERLLNWGFSMNGKVQPVGTLVAPLPAVATRASKPRSARRPASAAVATSPTLPVLPLEVGAALLAVLTVGFAVALSRRRRVRRWTR